MNLNSGREISVKSCGKRHRVCGVCKPDVFKKTAPKPKEPAFKGTEHEIPEGHHNHEHLHAGNRSVTEHKHPHLHKEGDLPAYHGHNHNLRRTADIVWNDDDEERIYYRSPGVMPIPSSRL